jgi:hypothetical protein
LAVVAELGVFRVGGGWAGEDAPRGFELVGERRLRCGALPARGGLIAVVPVTGGGVEAVEGQQLVAVVGDEVDRVEDVSERGVADVVGDAEAVLASLAPSWPLAAWWCISCDQRALMGWARWM